MQAGAETGTTRIDLGQGYPIRVEIDIPQSNSRLFAIPAFGYLARLVLLIPHVIVLLLVGIGVYFSQFVLWAFVLFGGKYPAWGYTLVGGYLRYTLRVGAYTYGLTDRYPPFRLGN